jgi:hypothetical protein
VRAVAEAHTLDDRWRDALGVHHRLEGGHILSQEVLVDAPKRPEIRAERRACSFAAVAVDFAPAVAIIITRPFVGAVAHGRMVGMQPRVIAGFVRKEEDTGGSAEATHYASRTTLGSGAWFPALRPETFDTRIPLISNAQSAGLTASAQALNAPSIWLAWIENGRQVRVRTLDLSRVVAGQP